MQKIEFLKNQRSKRTNIAASIKEENHKKLNKYKKSCRFTTSFIIDMVLEDFFDKVYTLAEKSDSVHFDIKKYSQEKNFVLFEDIKIDFDLGTRIPLEIKKQFYDLGYKEKIIRVPIDGKKSQYGKVARAFVKEDL